ncbi:MAG TPA: response regulator [Acetobacteraceae bacterium]|nr:response regulator [Acetobacteraceae bacterium]
MPVQTATILRFTILLLGFLGLLQLWLWRRDRTLVALAIWGIAELLGAVATALALGRDVLPHWVSVQVAVTLMILGAGISWAGARRFERRPSSALATVTGACIWLLACQVPIFYQNLLYRVVGGSILLGGYQSLCMREFLRRRPGSDLSSRGALAALFGADAAMQFLRAAMALWMPLDRIAFDLPASPWFRVMAMIGVVFLTGTSLLLIAVAKEEAEQTSVATVTAARDEAERANQAKSRFLARMSHELRTPLNGMLGMAQALTRDPRLDGEPRERAVVLEQSGKHLLAIINDILDLAGVEAGSFQLNPQPTALGKILQDSIEVLSDTAAAKCVFLDLDQAPGVPAFVRADPLRVRQILLNLLGNALKFTPAGGRVTLSASWHPRPGLLRLEVTDTGRGVPATLRPHLFQDIARRPLDMAATEGTGLGLAITASLAQAMGGTLQYRPGRDDVGSVFTAELPLPVVDSPGERPPLRFEPRPITGQRVLVVDDVASNRKLAEAVLRQAGCVVQLAEDGAMAVAALAAGAVPDVVLMDVFMPDLDGIAATRQIRALPGRAGKVPIIGLTADATPDRLPIYREAGMNDCITKPFAVDDLLSAIGRALSAGHAASLLDDAAAAPDVQPHSR